MAVDYQLCLFVVWSINVFTGRGSSGYEQIFSRVLHGNKMLWNTAIGAEKIKEWWPDPTFLHIIVRWNGAYFPSAQGYVGVPLRRNERSVFAPHDAPRLLLDITSEAFSLLLHYTPGNEQGEYSTLPQSPSIQFARTAGDALKISPRPAPTSHTARNAIFVQQSNRTLYLTISTSPKTHFRHEEMIADVYRWSQTLTYSSARELRHVANDGTFVSAGLMEICPLLLGYADICVWDLHRPKV